MRTPAIVASIALLVGCGTSSSGMGDDGANEDGGTPENPVPFNSTPYMVETTVDFTVEAILPPQIDTAVVVLRRFSTNPARALYDIAEK
jgi:hypothetical protein